MTSRGRLTICEFAFGSVIVTFTSGATVLALSSKIRFSVVLTSVVILVTFGSAMVPLNTTILVLEMAIFSVVVMRDLTVPSVSRKSALNGKGIWGKTVKMFEACPYWILPRVDPREVIFNSGESGMAFTTKMKAVGTASIVNPSSVPHEDRKNRMPANRVKK